MSDGKWNNSRQSPISISGQFHFSPKSIIRTIPVDRQPPKSIVDRVTYCNMNYPGCEADSYANPIPRSFFFSGRKKIYLVRANRNRLLVRDQIRRWCSGHLFVCSCDSAVRFLDSDNSSQRRLLLCLEETHRVHFARPWTQASKPALTGSSLAAKRLVKTVHVVFLFNQASEPSTMSYAAAAVCTRV